VRQFLAKEGSNLKASSPTGSSLPRGGGVKEGNTKKEGHPYPGGEHFQKLCYDATKREGKPGVAPFRTGGKGKPYCGNAISAGD